MIDIAIIVLGLLIGSFLNVCIYRIPKEETIVTGRSHCMYCGKDICWYDLIPVFSYIILGGKCRNCKHKLSFQYPFVELLNAIMYYWIYIIFGDNYITIIYCLLASALIVLSLIDCYHFIIPDRINLLILVLGLIQLIIDFNNWKTYIIGFFAVSLLLLFIAIITKGQMGGGDIKLMAAAGLLIGWQKIWLALIIGCIAGSILGITLILLKKGSRKIPFGPYLSFGIITSILYGNEIIEWYLNLFLN